MAEPSHKFQIIHCRGDPPGRPYIIRENTKSVGKRNAQSTPALESWYPRVKSPGASPVGQGALSVIPRWGV
jgi:hypothetical protein